MTANGPGSGSGGVSAAVRVLTDLAMSSSISRSFSRRAPHAGQAGHGPSYGGVTYPCLLAGVGQSAHMSSAFSRGTASSLPSLHLMTSRSALSLDRCDLSSATAICPSIPGSCSSREADSGGEHDHGGGSAWAESAGSVHTRSPAAPTFPNP
jgi:hypothetical protein